MLGVEEFGRKVQFEKWIHDIGHACMEKLATLNLNSREISNKKMH